MRMVSYGTKASSLRVLSVLCLLGGGVVSRAAGQAGGLPVRNAGVAQGFTVAAEAGFGKIPSSAIDEKSRAVGVSAQLGFGPLGFAVGATRVTIDPAAGPNRTTTAGAATAQLTVFGGPLVPLKVTWQAGLARALSGDNTDPWRGHVGIGAALAIPATVVSIRPWIAPRLDYLGDQPVSGARLKGAVSAGIDLGLLNGVGFRASYDSRLGWDNGLERASGIAFGVSYHL